MFQIFLTDLLNTEERGKNIRAEQAKRAKVTPRFVKLNNNVFNCKLCNLVYSVVLHEPTLLTDYNVNVSMRFNLKNKDCKYKTMTVSDLYFDLDLNLQEQLFVNLWTWVRM